MKTRFITLLLAQFLCISSFSGNIKNKYKSYLTEKGTVYFIMPQKMPKAENSTAHKDLIFDVTCINTSDTVAVTATIHTTNPIKDSLVVLTIPHGKTYSVPTIVIYRDLNKKGYTNRLKFNIQKNTFSELFNASLPFYIDYGNGCVFAFKRKTWAEYQLLFNSVMNLMDLDK